MKAFGILLVAGAIAILACAARRASLEVVVRNRDFQVTRTIAEATNLSSFDELWHSKHKVAEPVDLDWQYKLDIRTGDDVVRWLYDPRGYARVLTVKNSPVWQLPDPQAFNAVLGLSNNAAAADAFKGPRG